MQYLKLKIKNIYVKIYPIYRLMPDADCLPVSALCCAVLRNLESCQWSWNCLLSNFYCRGVIQCSGSGVRRKVKCPVPRKPLTPSIHQRSSNTLLFIIILSISCTKICFATSKIYCKPLLKLIEICTAIVSPT